MVKKPFKRGSRWIFIIGILAILSIGFANRSVHLLLIEDARRARPVFVMKIHPGDMISIGFLHSVENCHVWDHLQIDSQFELIVVATEFAESRTGLPYAAFEGESFERLKDGFRISNMHRRVPEIYQWVDSKYENTLKINGDQVIPLASLAGNILLHIHIAKRTLLEWAIMEARLF
ncbi:DUF1850 domain-containing protein [bacterium]|nr:DUF1850 domain-containing protein [bacterium]